MPGRYRIKQDTFHYKWSNRHRPAISIKNGDTVTFEVNDVFSWQLAENWESEDLTRLDPAKLYPLSGPVYVEGATPSDALVVEVVSATPGTRGVTTILPGFCLLEEFTKPYLYRWDLKNRRFAPFKNGIKIPLEPFCGVLGVAPKEEGFFEVMSPGRHGGNMDIKHLAVGSTVKIPVLVDGALFSVGDFHAAQGDGEVCGSAIECPGTITLAFRIEKGRNLITPEYITSTAGSGRMGYFSTTGISPDLMMAAKESVRHMIEYLSKRFSLSKADAYILCSVAADLRVHEVVDQPNWVVGTMIPNEVFPR